MITIPLRWLLALLRGALTIIGVLIIAFAVLTLGARAGLPFASGYTGEIEAGLSDYLGQPVSVEQLEFRWRASGPELRAMGLVVGAGVGDGDTPGRTVDERIAISEALIDVDVFATAWHRRPVLNELTLVGVDLALERDTSGVLRVRGLDRSGPLVPRQPVSTGGGLLDSVGWLFDARRVGLVDARLELLDRQQSKEFTFAQINLSVRNDGDTHRLRADVELPDRLGGNLDIGIDLDTTGRVALTSATERMQASELSGDFQLRSDRLDIAQIAQVLGQWGMPGLAPLAGQLPGGELALDLGGRLSKGRIEWLDGQMELDSLVAASRPDAQRQPVPALPDSVTLPIDLSRDGKGWTLIADGIDVRRTGQQFSVDTLRVRQQEAGWRVDLAVATPAPLDLVASLAGLVPLPLLEGKVGVAALDWLGAAAPQGVLRSGQLAFASHNAALAAAADLEALSFAPVEHVPGVAHLDVALRFADETGSIDLMPTAGESVSITAASAFSEPLELSRLDARLRLDAHGAPGMRLSGPVSFASGTLSADSRVTLEIDGERSPRVDLRSRVALGDVTELPALLPDRLLGPGVIDWFEQAFVSGEARDGDLLWFGRIGDFPYDDGDGVFRATLQAADVTLDWAPEWPAARALDGRVSFEGASFEARVDRGEIDALTIDRSRITIDDMRLGQLSVVSSGTGALPAMLDFATGGPLAPILGPALEDASGNGQAGLDLTVRVPLSDRAKATNGPLSVDGSLFLDGNELAFARADIALDDVIGGIGFDEQGARLHNVKANWLDRPIRLDAQTSGQGAARQLTLELSGALEASEVIAHYKLPLDRFVSGSSHWDATLTVPFDERRLRADGVALSATSELIGTALELPTPLSKSASRAQRFTLSTAIRIDEPTVRWRVDLEQGNGMSRLAAIADVADARLLSLAIGLGDREAHDSGRPGVRIDGAVESLDADGWAEALARLIEDIETATSEDAAARGQVQGEVPILPISGQLDVARLELRDASLGAARLRLNSDDDYLNTAVDNAHINGNVRYPRQRVENDGKLRPILARLAKVDTRLIKALLGESEVQQTSTTEPDTGPDPRTLPPIDAHIASLRYDGLDLQSLNLRTVPSVAGLEIESLGFTHRDLQLFASGEWSLVDPLGFDKTRENEHVTSLSLTLQSGNFQAGLADIGLDRLLGGTAGRAVASLRWAGPAWRPELETLDGNVEVSLERGRVVPLEPGAGKLIGLFAFQALPRRLSLDFSDVTGDGLAFNTIEGRGTFKRGVLETSLLELTGPVGVIDVVGTTDLVSRTLDQQVMVLPRVSAALPIIGAISGGASAGLTVLIAGGVLKALGVDFDRLGLRQYRLIGSWDQPELIPADQ